MEAGNGTEGELPLGPVPLLALPVVLSVVWALYELFYAPRVLAFLVTKLANLFLTDSGIYISKLLSCSTLHYLIVGTLQILITLSYYTEGLVI